MVDEQPPESNEGIPIYWRQLAGWERTVAIICGTVTGGLGFLAMFISSNQAGPAVALLIAGVLILLGIQGTPLARLGAKEYSVEMGRTRERAREIIAEAALDISVEKPDRARAVLNHYDAIDQGARESPVVVHAAGRIYRLQVLKALDRLSGAAGFEVQPSWAGPGSLITAGDTKIAVIMSDRRFGAYADEHEVVSDRLVDSLEANDEVDATLVVVAAHSVTWQQALQRKPRVIVPWRDVDDDAQIVEAIETLKIEVADTNGAEGPPVPQ